MTSADTRRPGDPDRAVTLGTTPGLCGDCVHAAVSRSARSAFLRCGLAARDPRFPRYPRLPVLTCTGYRPGGAEVDS